MHPGSKLRLLANRTLVVHRKGGKTVTIPLAPRLARALDLSIGDRIDGPLFTGANGGRLTRDAAARMVRRVAEAAGITIHPWPDPPKSRQSGRSAG